jgi:hypothetical protein
VSAFDVEVIEEPQRVAPEQVQVIRSCRESGRAVPAAVVTNDSIAR